MNISIETWCPIFPGFYSTFFECDSEESEIEHINELREEKNFPAIDGDKCDFDYQDYSIQVSKKCVNYLEEQLQDILAERISLKYDGIHSPREYNFYNDSINITVKLQKNTIAEIKKYLIDNESNFASYLHDHYTSYDGFFSSHSNEYFVWINEYLPQIEDNAHYLGAILDFILTNEEITDHTMYEDIEFPTIEAKNYTELTEKKEV